MGAKRSAMERISDSLVEREASLASAAFGAGCSGAAGVSTTLSPVKSFSEKSRGGLESWARRVEARRSRSAAFIFTSGAKAHSSFPVLNAGLKACSTQDQTQGPSLRSG